MRTRTTNEVPLRRSCIFSFLVSVLTSFDFLQRGVGFKRCFTGPGRFRCASVSATALYCMHWEVFSISFITF
jgi:hypothetical protein